MSTRRWMAAGITLPVLAAWLAGCAAPQVDFAKIQPPPRATELDHYKAFVGTWTWEAELVNATDQYKKWTGTASWQWALEDRCLQGNISVQSGDRKFTSMGLWTWNPQKKKYEWCMFNNWGYPQEGSATYDEATKTWHMPYESTGLDGTASRGVYTMKVVDADTLEWTCQEWADHLHLVKKMEMKGTYKRGK